MIFVQIKNQKKREGNVKNNFFFYFYFLIRNGFTSLIDCIVDKFSSEIIDCIYKDIEKKKIS